VALNYILITNTLRNESFDICKDSKTISCVKPLVLTLIIPACVLEVDRHRDHALDILALTIQSLAPCIALVYIIPVDKVKKIEQIIYQLEITTFVSNNIR
jgi:hypothetical protein